MDKERAKNYEEHFKEKVLHIQDTGLGNVLVTFENGDIRCFYKNTTQEIEEWNTKITGEHLYVLSMNIYNHFSEKLKEQSAELMKANKNINSLVKNVKALTQTILNKEVLLESEINKELEEIQKLELVEYNRQYKVSIFKTIPVYAKILMKCRASEEISEQAGNIISLIKKDVKDSMLPRIESILEKLEELVVERKDSVGMYLDEAQEYIKECKEEMDEEDYKSVSEIWEEFLVELEKIDGYGINNGLVVIPKESVLKNVK